MGARSVHTNSETAVICRRCAIFRE